MPTFIRRSNRERKTNPKYTDSRWDEDVLQHLRRASGTTPTGSDEELVSHVSSSSEEFEPKGRRFNSAITARDAANEDDQANTTSSDGVTQSSDVHDEEDSSNGEDDSDVSDQRPRPKRKKIRVLDSNGQYSRHRTRGIEQMNRKGATDVMYPQTYGPRIEDLKPVLEARDTWLSGYDITLPSRRTLNMKNQATLTSPNKPFPHQANEGSLDSDDSSKDPPHLVNNTNIDVQSTTKKLANVEYPAQTVYIGPSDKQTTFALQYQESLQLGHAWPTRQTREQNLADAPLQVDANRGSPRSYHQGWLINIGARVQCLAWVPCSSETQYLAVSGKSTSMQRAASTSSMPVHGPAFEASPNYRSDIQLWAFTSVDIERSSLRTLSYSSSPQLKFLIATNYGDVRDMQWAPFRFRALPSSSSVDHRRLAVLSADGLVHVLILADVEKRLQTTITIQQDELNTIDLPPSQNSVFTAMAWMSDEDLAVGTSQGQLRLYHLPSDMSSNVVPEPYMVHNLHTNYVITLCPATSPDSQTILASTSVSGDLLLTDLRSPEQDRVHLVKARLPTKSLVYVPFTRSFITTIDHSGGSEPKGKSQTLIVCHHHRHFYSGVQLAKLPGMSGHATALAASAHHPCLLVGNAKGAVFATNYLRKVLPSVHPSKVVKSNTGAYLQKICEYEWQPAVSDFPEEKSASKPQEIDIYHGRDTRPGISRFYEGFKPEKVILTPGNLRTKKGGTGDSDLTSAEVIFEEEQAVTAIQWNPNPHFAGWAAMGWGSGIVRIQDLSFDPA